MGTVHSGTEEEIASDPEPKLGQHSDVAPRSGGTVRTGESPDRVSHERLSLGAYNAGTATALEPPLPRGQYGEYTTPKTVTLPRSEPQASADAPPVSSRSGFDYAAPVVDRIGQYEVIRELGRGGMGVVYLARDERLGRKVAIKVLQVHEPELTRRFVSEARTTALCSHENIVVIHDVGEYEGSPFMVLEYLEGQTLSALLKKSGPLAPSRAVELIVFVVRALVIAHQQGIVHRDLKPENIFITESGTVKVLDFGIAKVLNTEWSPSLRGGQLVAQHPQTGLAGTLGYMSPEQWGADSIDARTDIWAVGLILFEALAGVHPLTVLGVPPQVCVPDLERPMPDIAQAAPATPAALASVVNLCLMKRKQQRVATAVDLLKLLEPFLPGRSAYEQVHFESGPYAGLRSFQEEDAGRFFGRDREIAAMAARIRDVPLTAAIGPSGIGKSSFMRAGVIPALKNSGENWSILVARPGREPVLALAMLLAPLVSTSSTLMDDLSAQHELAARLRAEPGYLGGILRASARLHAQRILLFVDQFEELHTLGATQSERLTFTACLAGAADDAMSPVRVVTSMRSDFLDRVGEDPRFMNELAKGLFFLGSPSSAGLREALVRPGELAGYRFESDAMVDDMVRHLESVPGALPLLQFTAAQLWERRDVVHRRFTLESYGRLGGIAGALASHADEVVDKFSAERQALCRSLFLHLVTPERTRAVRSARELADLVENPLALPSLVDALVDARLLVVQNSATEGATIEIVHESLLSSWPRLRRWLDESHEDSVFLEQLRSAARQWQLKRQDVGLLWGGEMVSELSRFQRRYRGELPPTAQAFVKAVFEQSARGTRRKRLLIAASAALLTSMLAAAVVALVLIRREQRAAELNARAATEAGQRAERRLHEVEAKERQRQEEEERRRRAELEVAKASQAAIAAKQAFNDALVQKNTELLQALGRADEQRRKAKSAQVYAEQNESAAKSAEERARRAAAEIQQLLDKERERSERLSSQLGSPLVEVLN